MKNKNIDLAFEDAKAELDKNINEFRAALDAGTKDTDHFLTLAEIEEKWSELNKKTSKTYSDIVSAYLSNIEESELIRSKKDSSGRKESS